MDAGLFADSIEYELLTQSIYKAIMRRDNQRIDVKHDITLGGRSGVNHQIDVYWRFKLAGVEHAVLIECKNYSTALTLEKVRSFFAVLHDVGNCNGIMVCRTGYQSGVEQFAKYYGIGLKLLRHPEPEDWAGKIKDVLVDLRFRSAVSTEDRPIQVNVKLHPSDAGQELRLKELASSGRLVAPSAPSMIFWSAEKQPVTEELRYWLPRQLEILSKADGGPYQQCIPLDGKYLLFNAGDSDEELVKVDNLDVTYYVETTDNREVAILGERLVEAVLRDFASGEFEYVKMKK